MQKKFIFPFGSVKFNCINLPSLSNSLFITYFLLSILSFFSFSLFYTGFLVVSFYEFYIMCFNILLLLHFRYDPISKTCIEFKFGGCDGNANNYKTQADVSLFPFNDNLLYNLYLLQLHFYFI